MLLIHTPKLTNRLGYTLNTLFGVLLRTEFSITTDEAYFLAYSDAKLCYGPRRLGDSLHIKSVRLLFETTIDEQQPRPFVQEGQWMLFPVYGSQVDLPFDPLAASFYMMSRYEEYLPHRQDVYGRFPSSEHVAIANGFATEPVVEQWALMIKQMLLDRYPDMHFGERRYQMVQTVDIDSAWCFLHKGFYRTMIGWARDLLVRRSPHLVRQRWRVLIGREPDPFDTFDYIIAHHRRSPDSHLLFFALLAEYGQYDKPVNYHSQHAHELLQHLGDHAKMGIHPGFHALENPANVDIETARLQSILHRHIVRSRYHFLRLQLPQSYRILLHAGLKHDYSMGFANQVGFRAGISTPYPFYDLERDAETELTIHPFCAMDTAMRLGMQLEPGAAIEIYEHLISNIRAVNGTFCCIVHNQNLSAYDGWEPWREVYEKMLQMAHP